MAGFWKPEERKLDSGDWTRDAEHHRAHATAYEALAEHPSTPPADVKKAEAAAKTLRNLADHADRMAGVSKETAKKNPKNPYAGQITGDAEYVKAHKSNESTIKATEKTPRHPAVVLKQEYLPGGRGRGGAAYAAKGVKVYAPGMAPPGEKRGPLQTGEKGGQYYVGPRGVRVYVTKNPGMNFALSSAPAQPFEEPRQGTPFVLHGDVDDRLAGMDAVAAKVMNPRLRR